MILLLLLALGVAWDALRTVAWHGWAALEIYAEAVLALAVTVIVAGVRADTAKAYSTEKRVNDLTRRTWSVVYVTNRQVANVGTDAELSVSLTIPAGQVTPGAEYEIYVEGDGTWQGNQLTMLVHPGNIAQVIIGDMGIGAGRAFGWWARAVFSFRAAGGAGNVHVQLHGAIWDQGDGANTVHRHNNGGVFGRSVNLTTTGIDFTVAQPIVIVAHWTPSFGVITSYKTKITRRGGT